MQETAKKAMPVLRRKVFFIHGFDPGHPRKYLDRYRAEAAKQAGVSGYKIEVVEGDVSKPNTAWSVSYQSGPGAQTTQTDIEVLAWGSIAKDEMSRSRLVVVAKMIIGLSKLLLSGALSDLLRLDRRKALLMISPYIVAVMHLLFVGLAAYIAYSWTVWALMDHVLLSLVHPLSVAAALSVAMMLVFLLRRGDKRFRAYFSVHVCNFLFSNNGAITPGLSAQIETFVSQIKAAVEADCDEVLVVGHSLGANIAIVALADLLRRQETHRNLPALGLLTLGHFIPNMSFLKDGWRIRRDIAYLSGSSTLTWVDVTAPDDPCVFALIHPASISELSSESSSNPLVLSAQYRNTLSVKQLRYLKRHYFHGHMQYLYAFDNPGRYDFFELTAGSETLKKRFQGQRNSPSCRATPVARYISTAPE